MAEPICVQVKKWKDSGLSVKYMQCDNAGENWLLEKRYNSAEWQLGVHFEYTSQDTSQQNHLAELKLALLANKGWELMIDAKVSINKQCTVCNEATMTATLTDRLTAIDLDGTFATKYMHLLKKNPAFAEHLCT
eukprot:9360056-Ditylum_brightwellii.AAC.1